MTTVVPTPTTPSTSASITAPVPPPTLLSTPIQISPLLQDPITRSPVFLGTVGGTSGAVIGLAVGGPIGSVMVTILGLGGRLVTGYVSSNSNLKAP